MTLTAAASLPTQLALVKEELLYARERARAVCKGLDAATWAARPAPDEWAIGEGLTHLNATSERFIPIIDDAIRDGRARKLEGNGPYGKGLIGWALQRFLEPPYTIKTKTAPAFIPATVSPMPETLERFDYLQQEVQVRIDRSAGLALDRLRVVSPFDARVKYNLYAAFCLIATHQRRHLWQAEQVRVRVVG
ncbi:MAG: DinB family protein [Vicinamibacteria bacterium]|nr:DinB family protein [Vicinamibacteria bacterium]